MAHGPTRRAGWIAGLALCAGLAASAAASGPGVAVPGTPSAPPCAPATIEDIRLDSHAAVDEIRIVVADHSPAGGVSKIVVDAGNSERILNVHGDQSKSLQFSPALTSNEFRVSLEPVFAADRDACVTRIDLLSGGSAVASVRP